ncbi:nucleotide-binding universal stress UspA family protein [Nocardioides luteus]|uniref:universal stress protein n=1 Tax=Nocardioides luteus TaxID=1844 RepID=UPI0028675D1C|nr:universal stress protein [Nocardioides luteus]MDR7311293.1 nucleotide-binding universal stress UspA family protein [Nocardioides luteus]
MSEHDRILVAVDGGEGGRAALGYASGRARAGDADLWLVHVIDLAVATGVFYPYGYAGLAEQIREAGAAVLARAEKEAAELVGADRVSATLLDGAVATELVHAATEASLVILGDERRHGLSRIVTGSVTGRVAARAPAPVVVVPTGWHAGPDTRRVVVAVADCDGSADLVARGLEEAADRGGDLVVVHAWEVPPVYYETTLGGLDAAGIENEARHRLTRTLERAREMTPEASGTEAWIEVRRGQAARVLVQASSEAALLMLGRRGHAFPLRRLGGTGHALLREATCPVEVVPPPAQET